MGQNKKTRERRSFTEEFKRDATNLALDSSKPVSQIASDLGVKETTLGNWVRKERELREDMAEGVLTGTNGPSWLRCGPRWRSCGWSVTCSNEPWPSG